MLLISSLTSCCNLGFAAGMINAVCSVVPVASCPASTYTKIFPTMKLLRSQFDTLRDSESRQHTIRLRGGPLAPTLEQALTKNRAVGDSELERLWCPGHFYYHFTFLAFQSFYLFSKHSKSTLLFLHRDHAACLTFYFSKISVFFHLNDCQKKNCENTDGHDPHSNKHAYM